MNMGRIVRHKPTPTNTGFGYSENTLFDVIAILHKGRDIGRLLAQNLGLLGPKRELGGGDGGELK